MSFDRVSIDRGLPEEHPRPTKFDETSDSETIDYTFSEVFGTLNGFWNIPTQSRNKAIFCYIRGCIARAENIFVYLYRRYHLKLLLSFKIHFQELRLNFPPLERYEIKLSALHLVVAWHNCPTPRDSFLDIKRLFPRNTLKTITLRFSRSLILNRKPDF